jgi:hypothetical protein
MKTYQFVLGLVLLLCAAFGMGAGLGVHAAHDSAPSAVFGLVKISDGNYHPVAQFKSMDECTANAKKAYGSPEGNTEDTKSIVLACGAVYDQPR